MKYKFFRRTVLILGLILTISLVLLPNQTKSQGPFTGGGGGKLAVTPAGYDNIGDVLKKLGFSAQEIQESDLKSLANIQNYDVLYINCSGGIDSVVTEAATAVRDYVKNGGIVYASDYANSLIQAAFPDKINFYKGSQASGIPGSEANTARVGAPGKVQAKVTDPGLAAVLGKTTVEVNYDLGAWVVIDSVSGGSRVHMSGPAPIIDFGSFDPKALEELGTIDYSNPQSIEEFNKKFYKPSKTLEDKPYVVSFSEGKGEVLYTTFHNEAQVTEDVKSVLNWFAVRAKGGRLARQSQELVSQGGNQVLQEIVDGINKGETKTYSFTATGTADVSLTLNFGGSTLLLTISDPKGKQVVSQKVDKPPYTQKIAAEKGQYKVEIKGVDVSEQNMPFVVTLAGPKGAIEEQVATTTTPTPAAKPFKLPFSTPVLIGLGALVLGLIIVVAVVILVVRKRG